MEGDAERGSWAEWELGRKKGGGEKGERKGERGGLGREGDHEVGEGGRVWVVRQGWVERQ